MSTRRALRRIVGVIVIVASVATVRSSATATAAGAATIDANAESVLYDPGLPVTAGAGLPWAAAVARTDGGLVPLLDLAALGARISEASAA